MGGSAHCKASAYREQLKHRNTRTNIDVPSGIRIRDSSVRGLEDIMRPNLAATLINRAKR
jgi:hypothetical protein